ncbi:DUF1351 domain-containing protein [Weissella muntiaci]|uniref:DUF1351 domain-containing protein n=1 Tax=Weissella muntiaci TaxID=2508881 RepID=A0A6C2CA65_9LACO|nr:DUF1351 domain-containing protein [Weissella muntiaci]TYC49935.1 DUF1351 domain-containing protein [Weissella muntiaci]
MENVEMINVDYQAATINIPQKQKFEQYVNDLVLKYQDFAVDSNNLTAARSTRAEINKVLNEIDTQRKDVKRAYNEPLKTFENWVKQATSALSDVKNTIDEGIKVQEHAEQVQRVQVVRDLIHEAVTDTQIDERIFTESIEDWAKNINFNKDFKPKKVLVESIQFEVDKELERQAEREKDVSAIANFAFSNNIPDSAYIRMLDNGESFANILLVMQSDVQKERDRQAYIAKQAAESAQENETEEVAPKTPEKLLKTTGAVTSDISDVTSEYATYRAKIELDFESVEEKDRWKQVMADNGFAEYKLLSWDRITDKKE